jgi:hypothetical protein
VSKEGQDFRIGDWMNMLFSASTLHILDIISIKSGVLALIGSRY